MIIKENSSETKVMKKNDSIEKMLLKERIVKPSIYFEITQF